MLLNQIAITFEIKLEHVEINEIEDQVRLKLTGGVGEIDIDRITKTITITVRDNSKYRIRILIRIQLMAIVIVRIE